MAGFLDRYGAFDAGMRNEEAAALGRRREARQAFKDMLQLMPGATPEQVFGAYTAALPSFDPYTKEALPVELLQGVAAAKAREKTDIDTRQLLDQLAARKQADDSVNSWITDQMVSGARPQDIITGAQQQFGDLLKSPMLAPYVDQWQDPDKAYQSNMGRAIVSANERYKGLSLNEITKLPNYDSNPVLQGLFKERASNELNAAITQLGSQPHVVATADGKGIDQTKLENILASRGVPVEKLDAGLLSAARTQLKSMLDADNMKMSGLREELRGLIDRNRTSENAITDRFEQSIRILPKDQAIDLIAKVTPNITHDQAASQWLGIMSKYQAELLSKQDSFTPDVKLKMSGDAWKTYLATNKDQISQADKLIGGYMGDQSQFKGRPDQQTAFAVLANKYWPLDDAGGATVVPMLADMVRNAKSSKMDDIVKEVDAKASQVFKTRLQVETAVRSQAINSIPSMREQLESVRIVMDPTVRDEHANRIAQADAQLDEAMATLQRAVATGDMGAVSESQRNFEAIKSAYQMAMLNRRSYVVDPTLLQANDALMQKMDKFLSTAQTSTPVIQSVIRANTAAAAAAARPQPAPGETLTSESPAGRYIESVGNEMDRQKAFTSIRTQWGLRGSPLGALSSQTPEEYALAKQVIRFMDKNRARIVKSPSEFQKFMSDPVAYMKSQGNQ